MRRLPVLFILFLSLTLPDKGFAQNTTRFMVVGDSRGAYSGVNDTILTEIVQTALTEDIEFVLLPGDLVYGSFSFEALLGQLLEWRDIVQPLYDAGVGVYPCRGNHDIGSRTAWDSVFSGPYALPSNGPTGEENVTFSFTYDSVFIVGLDHYTSWHRVNQEWLDDQFAANSMPHVFVFGHEPAFKVRHSDCLDDFPEQRDAFWNSIMYAGGRTYFSGHDHFYDHVRLDEGDPYLENDLHQFIVGTGGAPLKSDGSYDGNNGSWTPVRIQHVKQFGYVLVDIIDRDVTITWKNRISEGVYEVEGDLWTYVAKPYSCCRGLTGNVDNDLMDMVDISDVTRLIEFMFIRPGMDPPECIEEASTDGDPDDNIDIADLQVLLDYLFINYTPPTECR